MLESYIRAFTHLRTDTSAKWTAATKGRAPHKPFLLLTVIDLFAQGSIHAILIELTPELGSLFAGYWSRVMPAGQRGNLFLPFFHLRSSGFWHLVPRPGKEEALAAIRQIASMHQLNETVLGSQLDDELFKLLCAEASREALRMALIETYFAPEIQPILLAQSTSNVEVFKYSQELLEQAKNQVKEVVSQDDEYKPTVRDQGFRRAVVKIYDHRCAFCGVRMLTPDGHSVVDAAHIIPWSVSHNDDPHNGMALCRLCHWTFDEGLIGISHNYVMLLSLEMRAISNMPGHLSTLEGRRLVGPIEEELWPDLEALGWHRQNVFRKS